MTFRILFIAIIFMISLIPLTSCTATGPKFALAPPPRNVGDVLVYIYRTPQRFGGGSLNRIPIFIDDVKLASLYSEGYTWVHIPPGKHIVSIKWISERNAVWEFSPNRTHYLKLTVTAEGNSYGYSFEPVSADIGSSEIREYRYEPALGSVNAKP